MTAEGPETATTTAAAAVAMPRTMETRMRTRSRRPRSAIGESSGARIAVGDDAERHGEGPLGGPGAEEAELRTAQVRVQPVAREGSASVTQSGAAPAIAHGDDSRACV